MGQVKQNRNKIQIIASVRLDIMMTGRKNTAIISPDTEGEKHTQNWPRHMTLLHLLKTRLNTECGVYTSFSIITKIQIIECTVYVYQCRVRNFDVIQSAAPNLIDAFHYTVTFHLSTHLCS